MKLIQWHATAPSLSSALCMYDIMVFTWALAGSKMVSMFICCLITMCLSVEIPEPYSRASGELLLMLQH